MPRRKTLSDEHLIEPVLMLPSPRPAHRHERSQDAYEQPPGAVPVHVVSEPIKRKMTREDLAARKEAQAEIAMRRTRYAAYLEELVEQNGNQEQALAVVYGIQVEEARLRRIELQNDVRTGLGATSLAEVLERNDLGQAARANLLRKHAYSP